MYLSKQINGSDITMTTQLFTVEKTFAGDMITINRDLTLDDLTVSDLIGAQAPDYSYELKYIELSQRVSLRDDIAKALLCEVLPSDAKKQEIVTLSAEALERNCWSGIVYTATTTGGVIASTGVGATTENVGNYTLIEDRDALEIYKKMAGPNLDYGAENPFDPTSIVTLTSSYSGFGHENIRDNGKTVSSDNTTEVSADDYNVGGGGDGSKEYLTNFETSPTVGSGQNVSSTSSNHIGPRNVGPFSAYAGVGVAPYATNTSLTGTAGANKCVAIANSISTLSSEITSLRTQRDAAVNRSNLNKVKEKKMEKELQNWGSNNVKSKQTQRKTSNADVISAVDAMI